MITKNINELNKPCLSVSSIEEGEEIEFKPDDSYLLYNPQTIPGF